MHSAAKRGLTWKSTFAKTFPIFFEQKLYGTSLETIWHHFFQNRPFRNSATWRFWWFWRFLVATFSNIIQIKLVIPIFHTKFDPLQVLFLSICKIPPTGDFGDIWWLLLMLLVMSSELSLWYQFFTQNLTLCKFYFWVFAKFRQLAILAINGGYY